MYIEKIKLGKITLSGVKIESDKDLNLYTELLHRMYNLPEEKKMNIAQEYTKHLEEVI